MIQILLIIFPQTVHGWNEYSSSSYLYTGQKWWTLSPNVFNNIMAGGFYVESLLTSLWVGAPLGVRPSVSLKNGTEFIDGGNGTVNNPYVVK